MALGYRPNVTARALRTCRTDVIGLIVPDITNPFFAQLAASVERAAQDYRHSLMLASSHDDREAEQDHVVAFLDRSVRGSIEIASSDNPDLQLKSRSRSFRSTGVLAPFLWSRPITHKPPHLLRAICLSWGIVA
ncbi:hypothetical protein OKA06_20190 [Novosphingobium sp. MW5]|nr:hypothetical protein [Novosphingobium sp. MW5]